MAPRDEDTVKRTGPWSQEEVDLLNAQITAYGEDNSMDREQLVDLVQYKVTGKDGTDTTAESDVGEKQKSHEFWAQLCAALPERTVTGIRRRARRTWHHYAARGAHWQAEEDDLLALLYKEYPNKWTLISPHLQRSPEDCRDRWRDYVRHGDARKVSSWDDEEVETLRQAVNECIQLALQKHKEEEGTNENYNPTKDLNWELVSEKVGGTRSRLQCFYKWKKLLLANDANDANGANISDDISDEADAADAGYVGEEADGAKPSSVSIKRASRQGRKPVKKSAPALRMTFAHKCQLIDAITRTDANSIEEIPWSQIEAALGDAGFTALDCKQTFESWVQAAGERDQFNDTLEAVCDLLGKEEEQKEQKRKASSDRPPKKRKRAPKTPAWISVNGDSDGEEVRETDEHGIAAKKEHVESS
ncbi:hypothetical protein GQ43DRAFT_444958 [Delitschia confertaspora ATCC 74209]|uniref:Myb-like DNA-binding domain protein n=1 Tax=Delitschia confertaspora ATCC 74209 TaxID=1513339 RepID=A0A9P4JBU8_9PLEO|nr:hypothetical protein GQ43DRAFT_444958 [Delitschia confertaspora ATCC 74209]